MCLACSLDYEHLMGQERMEFTSLYTECLAQCLALLPSKLSGKFLDMLHTGIQVVQKITIYTPSLPVASSLQPKTPNFSLPDEAHCQIFAALFCYCPTSLLSSQISYME